MKIDKFKIYILELLLVLILFFALFVPNIFSRVVLSIVLVIYMFLTIYFLKKRRVTSIYKKQVTILMFIFSMIYLATFYLMGLYFGYYEATVKLSFWSIRNYIIPLTLIIASSEIIRFIFLSQNNKYSKALVFISMVLIDLIVYTSVYDLTKLDEFLTVLGFILFASVSCNLLYNYISSRFGYVPILIYRLITVLYMYIIPFVPDVYIFFRSFLRMLYPYLIYLVLEHTYSKSNFAIAYKDKKKIMIGNTLLITFMLLLTMFISGMFKYGVLVIGSESMTGTINKGDAIIFEKYDNNVLKEGDIIVFKKGNIQIIHRIIDIKKINGEYRYFTKGDANSENDEGYVKSSQIIGTLKFRIMYIGYPTIWVNDIFS